MNIHGRKMIAPIIVVGCIVSYYFVLGAFIIKLNIPSFFKILAVALPGLVCAIFIIILIERIKEIRKGEEDDLSKY